ncbi:response regulator transcription factor [Lactiplantibacillus daowaiensis]|uniref:Helix-turn-helix domain-containing protein n=1 Tax=Lactiplantibacillus daowaiensis TaxID=2559918 RepID=A0ABW1RXF3_9LACO|nr:helix-turn-helix domain-containing protein [Lactiplantibacillus daowaiensis]
MRNLLIVDDEKALRNGLAHYLTQLTTPFDTITTAANGQSALAYFEHHPVTAALIDINLGDLNGLDLIDLINQRYPQTLIVIISGYDDFDFARRAVKLNVLDYLLKPIPRSDLQKLMQTFKTQLAPAPVAKPATSDLAQNGQAYIEAHYSDRNLSLAQAAQRLFVSEAHLSKQLKQNCGQTFSEYLIDYRINKARELLRNPNLQYSVCEIAHKVGYEDAHYFSRVFRKKVGQSPLQYRQAN